MNNNIPRYKSSMPLQSEFVANNDKSGDNIFAQVKRTGNVAIYKRSYMDGKVMGFEVITIDFVPAGTTFSKDSKPTETDSESYPGGKSFGKKAWFCVNMEQAEKKFSSLVKSANDKAKVSCNETAQTLTVDIPTGKFSVANFIATNCMTAELGVNTLKQLLKSGRVIRVDNLFQKA